MVPSFFSFLSLPYSRLLAFFSQVSLTHSLTLSLSLCFSPHTLQVNFLQWKRENNHRELQVLRRYHIQDRDDYMKYNKVCGMITKLVSTLKTLAANDPVRIEITDLMLDKYVFLLFSFLLSPDSTYFLFLPLFFFF